MKLIKPTVADVIAYLSTLEQDKPFRIRDPDTGWCIYQIYVDIDEEAVWFDAVYEEMSGRGFE